MLTNYLMLNSDNIRHPIRAQWRTLYGTRMLAIWDIVPQQPILTIQFYHFTKEHTSMQYGGYFQHWHNLSTFCLSLMKTIKLHTFSWQFSHFTTLSSTHTTVLRPFFRDHPGEPVPEENFWTLWCKGRLTEADTPTIRVGATPSGLTSAHVHHAPIFYRPDALPAAQPTVSKHWRQLAHSD